MLMEHMRKSTMFLNEVYFWTSTVYKHNHLFHSPKYKHLIVNTLKELVSESLVKVYAYVIMPNHVHFIWEMLKKNGNEMPKSSFNKKVSHEIIKDLKKHHPMMLKRFEVQDKDRKYRLWQRDPLAIELDSVEKLEQKLTYIHLNPLQEHWSLVKHPADYRWSSAAFYESDIDELGMMTHYKDRF